MQSETLLPFLGSYFGQRKITELKVDTTQIVGPHSFLTGGQTDMGCGTNGP